MPVRFLRTSLILLAVMVLLVMAASYLLQVTQRYGALNADTLSRQLTHDFNRVRWEAEGLLRRVGGFFEAQWNGLVSMLPIAR